MSARSRHSVLSPRRCPNDIAERHRFMSRRQARLSAVSCFAQGSGKVLPCLAAPRFDARSCFVTLRVTMFYFCVR